jgi:hypothetical protein
MMLYIWLSRVREAKAPSSMSVMAFLDRFLFFRAHNRHHELGSKETTTTAETKNSQVCQAG